MTKTLYKIYLLILKYLPIILAGFLIIHLILAYFNISAEIIATIGGISILPLIFMIVSSFMLKFCITHRLPLYYCLIDVCFGTIDYYTQIPIAMSYGIYFILAFVFIILYTIYHIKYGITKT